MEVSVNSLGQIRCAVKRQLFASVHSFARRTRRKPRSLRLNLRRRELVIDVHGRMAIGLIDGEYKAVGSDPSQVMRRLIEMVRSASPHPNVDGEDRKSEEG